MYFAADVSELISNKHPNVKAGSIFVDNEVPWSQPSFVLIGLDVD